MATIPLPLHDAGMLAPFPMHRFTVEEYRWLGETGLLTEDDRVELLEGWIVPKRNLNPPHSVGVQLVDEALRRRLPSSWLIRIQDAVTTGDSEPEPDVAVVRGSICDFVTRHPGPEDIGLLVEVADTSLARDRYKCRLYGLAAIPVYWIVNLTDRCVEVFTEPSGPDADPGFRRRQEYGPDAEVSAVLEDREIGRIEVSDLLP